MDGTLPSVSFFETAIQDLLKCSHQDLSNEGSNFILCPLEVSQFVAKIWPLFLSNSQMVDFGLLQKSQNKA